MYARAAKDRNFKILRGRQAEVRAQLENGKSAAEVAEIQSVSKSTILQFIEAHSIELTASSHPAVAHLKEAPLYKIEKNLVDPNGDYVIRRRSGGHKVYISVDEYIELKERAKHAKDMADAGASAGLVNGLLSSAN